MNFEEYYNHLQSLSAQVYKPGDKPMPEATNKRPRVRKRIVRKVYTGKKRIS